MSGPGGAGGSRGNHASAHARQSTGAVPWGEPLYGGAVPDTPVLESLSSHRGVMHSCSEPSGTHIHSHPSQGQGYNVTFSTPAPRNATVDSQVRSAHPLVRENMSLRIPGRPEESVSNSSSSWGRSGRNIQKSTVQW